MDGIEPNRLYSFAEAARLIPSPKAGKRTHLATMHRWRKNNRIAAQCRPSGGKRYWFILGSELIRLLGGPREFNGTTPAQRRRAHEAAMQRLRKRGLKV
jgi:hypothetical protein